jgi:hypothetical protein
MKLEAGIDRFVLYKIGFILLASRPETGNEKKISGEMKGCYKNYKTMLYCLAF